MMLKADFHTHTTYCDGKNTPAEMVKAAYDMGFTDFGISGHGDYSPAEPGFGMTDSILSSYMKELCELREQYRGKMNLYIGIETDCLGPVQKAEYTIGSTHYLEKNGTFVTVDASAEVQKNAVHQLWNDDWYAFTRDYYETEALVYDRTCCDWVGHFDLITKFNEGYCYFDESSDAYLEPALAAMKKLHRQGLPFEINTGAISRGYRTAPYPNPILLKELHAMGGRIIINSDSHAVNTIGYHFNQAVKVARSCGFDRTLILKPGGGFREIYLP